MTCVYEKEDAEFVLDQFRQMKSIVAELESRIPDRHFTMDGHLVGSIGEVVASYHYGIRLYESSHKGYDGIVGDTEVQIKITQRNKVMISRNPKHLLVMFLSEDGNIFEVYNGPGETALGVATGPDSHGYYHVNINKLVELNGKTHKTIVEKVPIQKYYNCEVKE